MYIKQLKLLLLLLVLTACTTGSPKNENDESRGNTMKRYLHYCTYEIWDGFREFIDYKFNILPNISNIIEVNLAKLPTGIEVRLNELPKTDKLNELIDIEIAKHIAELKRIKEYKYFGEVRRNNIKIGGNPAVVISYEFNGTCKKGESEFNYFLKRVENCYIKLKDKTIVIRGTAYAESSKEVLLLFEEFYKSYKPDQSQAFKTNYGSFKWIDRLRDESTIEYLSYDLSMENATYGIEISYRYDESKDIVNRNLSFQKRTVDTSDVKASIKKTKSDTTKTSGYNIQHDEINMVINKRAGGKWAEIRIFDFNPGIYIEVSEYSPNNFDKYRNELNAMIKSIQFYPDLKKDR